MLGLCWAEMHLAGTFMVLAIGQRFTFMDTERGW